MIRCPELKIGLAALLIVFICPPEAAEALRLWCHGIRALNDARIEKLFAEEDRLVGIAVGFTPDGKPLQQRNELAAPHFSWESLPEQKASSGKTYPYPDDYDFHKDASWKYETQMVEKRSENLIDEYIKKQGAASRTAAKLRDHISVLYGYSGDSPSSNYTVSLRNILFPACPRCHRKDEVGMISPSPIGCIEDQLKHGWWFCKRCDETKGYKPFKATKKEQR